METLVGRGSRTIYRQSGAYTLNDPTSLLGRETRRARVLRRAPARRVLRPNTPFNGETPATLRECRGSFGSLAPPAQGSLKLVRYLGLGPQNIV